jgi:uncharacterized protein YydD (DUF2326 family)
MLKEIRCDKFAPNHQVIKLNEGLNTVLGSSSGTNAIGKSTFLWVIDYAFGGDRYYLRISALSGHPFRKHPDSVTAASGH